MCCNVCVRTRRTQKVRRSGGSMDREYLLGKRGGPLANRLHNRTQKVRLADRWIEYTSCWTGGGPPNILLGYQLLHPGDPPATLRPGPAAPQWGPGPRCAQLVLSCAGVPWGSLVATNCGIVLQPGGSVPKPARTKPHAMRICSGPGSAGAASNSPPSSCAGALVFSCGLAEAAGYGAL